MRFITLLACARAVNAAVAFETKPELEKAVDLWLEDPAAAAAQYGPISKWNTSLITDMSELFCSSKAGGVCWHPRPAASSFNEDISAWDTKAVTDMHLMFRSAWAFNQPIGRWDTGLVEDMSSMFREATSFDQEIGTWNVVNLRSAVKMFFAARSFSADLRAWDISSLEDANEMFFLAEAFDSDLGWCFPGDSRYAFYGTKCAADKCGVLHPQKCRRGVFPNAGLTDDEDRGNSKFRHPILYGFFVLCGVFGLYILTATTCGLKCVRWGQEAQRKRTVVHVKTDFRGEPAPVMPLEDPSA